MMREPESQEEGRNCEPEEQAVRERAYAIWVAEGEPDGCEVEHWMRARRELELEHEAGPQ